MWWTEFNSKDLNLNTRALDTRFWSQTLRTYPFLKGTFKDKVNRLVGADLFNALYGWHPTIKDTPPDKAIAAWLRMFMQTEQFEMLKLKTQGDQCLAAAGAIRLFTELMRPKESVLKQAMQLANNLDQMKALTTNQQVLEAGEKAINKIQQQMAQSIEGNKGKKSDQLRDELEQLALDNAPERLLSEKLDQVADAEEAEQFNGDSNDLDDSEDGEGEDGEVDDTFSFNGKESFNASDALSKVDESLEGAMMLASLRPGQGWGNDQSAEALRILMDETLVTKVTRQDAFRQILKVAGRMMNLYAQAKAEKVPPSPPPIGVEFGDRLSDIVPSELGLLSNPDTEDLFYQRWAEGKLLIYDHKRKKASGKGPLVFCIDNSGSMTGQPWIHACAVYVALAGQALKEHRRIAVIRFATNVSDPTEIKDVEKLVEELEALGSRGLGFGTYFDRPLDKAVEFIDTVKAGTWANADVILITDGDCNTSKQWTDQYKETQKKLGIRVFGVNIQGAWSVPFKDVLTATVPMGYSGQLGKLEWFYNLAKQVV